MFRKMPFILMLIIVAIISLGNFIPWEAKQFLYAISLFIKSLIVFLLPLVIFALLFKVAVTLSHNATRIILLILCAVCCSNFISTFFSHYVGIWIYYFKLEIISPKEGKGLEAIWLLELPRLISNDKAMFSGLILGILFGMFKADFASKIAKKFDCIVAIILNSFMYLIPFFVTGFIVKLQADGVIVKLLREYALIFAVIVVAQFSYILVIYFIANNFVVSKFINSIKNILPAAIAGFSTMSSVAAMPLTIIGTEKNVDNKDLADSLIPATVNVHLVGDCFAIPILAYAVLKNYGMAEPTFMSYLIFAFYFVLAKFSVAAIPAGGIIVMLPILENFMGFNAEMLSLITALYILFDPVITCANVLGNGGFAIIMARLKLFDNNKKTSRAR